MDLDWASIGVVFGSSALTVGAAMGLIWYLAGRGAQQSAITVNAGPSETVFLFDGEHLLDATPSARQMLASHGPRALNDWHRLAAILTPRFPGFLEGMARLPETGAYSWRQADGENWLEAQWLRGTARIRLCESKPDEVEDAGLDAPSAAALNEELDMLRGAMEHLPSLVWQQDPSGAVIWANPAYLEIAQSLLPADASLTWPLPALFDADAAGSTAPRRAALTTADGQQRWFDCTVGSSEDVPFHYAQPADATVQAETDLRNFRQTLTKTFAGLTIGIAIFNRRRELVMFNPALTDLILLEPQFLAARPTLMSFLDRLRERQMIPEPKDYKTWRQKLVSLEEEAANGTYQEVWTLPTGQTYRVSGQPHPDGAVAFLFEDISAEISLTRRFRSELEMSQAVIDAMDEAIAVFSPAGVLSLSNAAYTELWGTDPSVSLCEIGIQEAAEHWQAACKPSNFWPATRDFVARMGGMQPQRHELELRQGGHLVARLLPLSGNATMVSFKRVEALDAPAEPAVFLRAE